MVKAKINKSYFYKDSEREEIFFYIEGSKKGKFCLGNGQDVYGRPRDYCNFVNDISVINHDAMVAAENFDATLYSSSKEANEKINEYIASSSYNYDEVKLKKDLEAFVSNSEKKDDAWHFQYCLGDIKNSSTNGLKHLSPEVQANCLNFVRDVIEENIEPTGRKIKSINDRRSFWDKIRGKNEVTSSYFSNLEYSISVLSGTKYIEEIRSEPKFLENYRSALSTATAILAMLVTNFAIDAPLTVKMTNALKKNFVPDENSVSQTKQQKEVRYG